MTPHFRPVGTFGEVIGHLITYPDHRSAKVVTLDDGRQVVEARISSKLSDGSYYNRTLHYDREGNRIGRSP